MLLAPPQSVYVIGGHKVNPFPGIVCLILDEDFLLK